MNEHIAARNQPQGEEQHEQRDRGDGTLAPISSAWPARARSMRVIAPCSSTRRTRGRRTPPRASRPRVGGATPLAGGNPIEPHHDVRRFVGRGLGWAELAHQRALLGLARPISARCSRGRGRRAASCRDPAGSPGSLRGAGARSPRAGADGVAPAAQGTSGRSSRVAPVSRTSDVAPIVTTHATSRLGTCERADHGRACREQRGDHEVGVARVPQPRRSGGEARPA